MEVCRTVQVFGTGGNFLASFLNALDGFRVAKNVNLKAKIIYM
jgi:hypothetical protein